MKTAILYLILNKIIRKVAQRGSIAEAIEAIDALDDFLDLQRAELMALDLDREG
jgi:hypothetical protein